MLSPCFRSSAPIGDSGDNPLLQPRVGGLGGCRISFALAPPVLAGLDRRVVSALRLRWSWGTPITGTVPLVFAGQRGLGDTGDRRDTGDSVPAAGVSARSDLWAADRSSFLSLSK